MLRARVSAADSFVGAGGIAQLTRDLEGEQVQATLVPETTDDDDESRVVEMYDLVSLVQAPRLRGGLSNVPVLRRSSRLAKHSPEEAVEATQDPPLRAPVVVTTTESPQDTAVSVDTDSDYEIEVPAVQVEASAPAPDLPVPILDVATVKMAQGQQPIYHGISTQSAAAS